MVKNGVTIVSINERHPDRTADTCKDYRRSNKAPWYEKYN